MATGMCYLKYQILYVLKSKQYLLHPATIFRGAQSGQMTWHFLNALELFSS